MISLLDLLGATASGAALLLLLIAWRHLVIEVKWVITSVCITTIVVNLSGFWEWRGRPPSASTAEGWGDYLQMLQPVLWGIFFYVVVQAAQRQKLQQSHRQMRNLVEHMPVILRAHDQDGRVLAWNRRAEEISGYAKSEVIGKSGICEQLFVDAQSRQQLLNECQNHGASYQHRIYGLLSKQQHQRQIAWYNISKECPIEGWANWGIGLDVTEQLAAQNELARMATHDELTTLPNRTLLRDRLEHALIDAHRNGCKGALLLLDLDHFKMVNDSHGHSLGDRLLREVGERLIGCIKSTDTLARFGGDEFVILLDRVHDPAEVSLVAERILRTLAVQPFFLCGNEISVRASIGITVFPDDDNRLDELLKNIDLALYAAKENGRDGYHFYSRATHNKLRWQHRVAEKLRTALATDSFHLQYQPQISLGSQSVTGVEALLRWQAFDQVPLSPSAFIPIAENMGLMPALGKWVVHEACRQASKWQVHTDRFSVSINLSTIQLYQANLVEALVRATEEQGIDPEMIEFEVTETSVMRDIDRSLATMRRLAQRGFSISLDDFGTGYSSLSYLKRMPVSKIKIDQSFVQSLETDRVDAAIVRSVISLGHSLGLKVIAEGVETQGQLDLLGNEGCDGIQGYFYSKPLMADSVLAYMNNSALH